MFLSVNMIVPANLNRSREKEINGMHYFTTDVLCLEFLNHYLCLCASGFFCKAYGVGSC